MNDAPETIWTAPTSGRCHVGFDTMSMNYTVEYRRADLPLTTDQLMADPRVKALVEAGNVMADALRGSYIVPGSAGRWSAALAQLKEPKQ